MPNQDKRGMTGGQANQPSQSLQNQSAAPPAKPDPAPAPAPESRPAATKPKKGLVNKKLDKSTAAASAQNAQQNAGAPAGASGSAEQSAPPSQVVSEAPAPTPAAAPPTRSESRAASPAQETNGTAGTGSRFNMGPIPPLPPKAQGAVASFLASNIKALNLEPMRSAPPGKVRPAAPPFGNLELPRSPGAMKAKAKAPATAAPEADLQRDSLQVPQPTQPTHQPADVPAPVVPVETSVPAAQPAPAQPAPAQPALSATGVNAQSPQPVAKTPAKKNFKLKNEKLARSGTAPKVEDGDAKEEAKPAPIVQEPIMPAAIAHDAPAVSLMPEDKVFSRELMLRIWQMHKAELHSSVTNLGVSIRPGDKTPVMERKKVPSKREEAPDRSSVFGTEMKKGPKKEYLPKPSENAYKVKEASGRMEELQRNATSLLNKICPDNLSTIVDHLASIKLVKAEELEYVIRIIFKKALAEPHYCETYADMVFALKERYPQFPPENEGEKPATFTRVLLNNCQNEFENMPATFEATDEDRAKCPNPEDLQQELKRKKDMMLANMKFIGHLFLRQLLAVKVIGQVVHDLIGIKENGSLPEEHMIECVCELLQAIGYTLDESSHGENLMNSFQARLKDLSKHLLNDGKQAFSKRIRFAIEDLLDLRKAKWQKKVFKEQAKTKNEVKGEASARPGKPVQEGHFSTQIAGMKPAYIEELKAQKPKKMVVDTGSGGKPSLDESYVKKIFQYYAEDWNGDSFAADWNKAKPTASETKNALVQLVNAGFEQERQEEAFAMAIAELVARKLVSCDFLKEALQPAIQQLEEWKIDAPQCDNFCQSLLEKLIEKDAFNPVILRALQPLMQSDTQKKLCWKQLIGCLRKLKKSGGQNLVRKALDIQELVSLAANARGCPVENARRTLESEC